MAVMAHRGGLDELIAFLALPALFLLYHLGKRLLGRRSEPDDVPEDPDEQRTGPASS